MPILILLLSFMMKAVDLVVLWMEMGERQGYSIGTINGFPRWGRGGKRGRN